MANKTINSNNKLEIYRVLPRQYRPKFFSELIGQETLVQTLTNAIKSNQIAHAYLLTGIRGVGKTTTARLIARALNCVSLENDYEPCGKCDSCKSILEERNMDVIEMDAASRTGVDDIREIIENVKYKPANSKYKIYIIDEVHMLSKNAFNALLKTLEEPPPHVKFLFATTEVQKLPITIVSRCQRFDLFRINNNVLTNHLINIAEKENIEIIPEALSLIVRAADGSVRDGLSLLDQANTNAMGKINTNHIIKMLGLADRAKVYDLLDLIFKGDAPGALTLFKELYSQGADVLMIFEEMLQITHFITEIKIIPKIIKDPYIPELEKNKGLEISKKISIPILGRFWQALFKGYQELQHASYVFQTSEMILIRLIFLSEGPSPIDLIKKIELNKDTNFTNDSIKSENLNNKIDPNQIINKSDINSITNNINNKNNDFEINTFRELVNLFYEKREGVLYSQLYNQVKLINFEEGKLLINAKDINDKNFGKKIAKQISKWTGRIWIVMLSDSNTGKSLAEEDIILKQKKIEKIKQDPEVKKILETFYRSTIHSIENFDQEKQSKEEEVVKLLKEVKE